MPCIRCDYFLSHSTSMKRGVIWSRSHIKAFPATRLAVVMAAVGDKSATVEIYGKCYEKTQEEPIDSQRTSLARSISQTSTGYWAHV